MKDRSGHISFISVFGFELLSFIVATMITGGLCLLFGIGLYPACAPFGMLLSIVATYAMFRDYKITLRSTLACMLTVCASILLMWRVYDTSWDGLGYHMDTIVMLADGWNPIYTDAPTANLWSQHYARGLELAGAAIVSLTGNLESAMSVNIIISLATLLICWHTLKEVSPQISAWWRFAIVAMVAMNTVLVQQILSTYNDFALWLETCLIACGIGLAWKHQDAKYPYAILFMTFVMAVNTKFTHFLFVGLECVFWAIWCTVFNRSVILKKSIYAVVAATIVGVAVVGFNPYVTNALNYGSPVYPLGTERVDIMTANTPQLMQEGNRIVNLAKNLLSTNDSAWAVVNGDVTVKSAINTYSSSGSRVNGFGILMPLMLAIGIVLMIIVRPPKRWVSAYLFIWLLCLIFREGWWARYVPFLWMNVIMPCVLALQSKKRNTRRAVVSLVTLVLVMMSCGAAITLAGTLKSRITQKRYMNALVETFGKESGVMHTTPLRPALRHMFTERGVTPHEDISNDWVGANLYRMTGNVEFDYYVEIPDSIYLKIASVHDILNNRRVNIN